MRGWGCAVIVGAFLGAGCRSTPSQSSEASSPEPMGQEAIAPFEAPKLLGRVNDHAGLLTPAEEAELTELYRSLEEELGCQMALLTIESLQRSSIDEYSLKVANAWGLGRRGVDDGVLITLALDEKATRIEVGYGLEAVISDEAANDVILRMVPEFRAGRFGSGLQSGSRELVEMIRSKRELIGSRKR
jgi:uncharacterized protein